MMVEELEEIMSQLKRELLNQRKLMRKRRELL